MRPRLGRRRQAQLCPTPRLVAVWPASTRGLAVSHLHKHLMARKGIGVRLGSLGGAFGRPARCRLADCRRTSWSEPAERDMQRASHSWTNWDKIEKKRGSERTTEGDGGVARRGGSEEADRDGKAHTGRQSAYQFPLLFKHIWNTPLLQARDQEVVYRDAKRFTYAQIWERINRLASALAAIGVQPGDTVGVLDWDSNRFLEAFFAIPMMGAVHADGQRPARPRADPLHDRSCRVDDASRQRRIRRTGQRAQAAIAERQAARRDVGPAVPGDGRPVVCRRI